MNVGRKGAAALAAAIALGTVSGASAADFELSIVDTGTRDYYCTTTLMVSNATDGALDEINGHLVLMSGDDAVGQSKGGSLLNAQPGDSTTAIFDAPNAPCDSVNAYRFVVGICRVDGQFLNAEECAGRIAGIAPVSEVVSR